MDEGLVGGGVKGCWGGGGGGGEEGGLFENGLGHLSFMGTTYLGEKVTGYDQRFLWGCRQAGSLNLVLYTQILLIDLSPSSSLVLSAGLLIC